MNYFKASKNKAKNYNGPLYKTKKYIYKKLGYVSLFVFGIWVTKTYIGGVVSGNNSSNNGIHGSYNSKSLNNAYKMIDNNNLLIEELKNQNDLLKEQNKMLVNLLNKNK